MSSETEQPRQRTVAELLAEYGDGSTTTTRRRRRRAVEDDDVVPVPEQAAPPAEPARPAPAPQVPDDPSYLTTEAWQPDAPADPAPEDDRFQAASSWSSAAADPTPYDPQVRVSRTWPPQDGETAAYEQPASSWDVPPSGPVAPASSGYDYGQQTEPALDPRARPFQNTEPPPAGSAVDADPSVSDSGVWRRARRIGRSLRLPDDGPPTEAAPPIDFDDESDAVRTDDLRSGRPDAGQAANGWSDNAGQAANGWSDNVGRAGRGGGTDRADRTWDDAGRDDRSWDNRPWDDGTWDNGANDPARDQRAGDGYAPVNGYRTDEGYQPGEGYQPAEGYRAGEGYQPDEGYRPGADHRSGGGYEPGYEPDEDYRMSPAGLDRMPDEPADDLEPRRRLGRAAAFAESAGQAWAVVVAQWIAGALVGAVVWVGFRYLWRSLPVVALAAAVLVTIGLVVVVRALLRSNDLRTTLFAVSVGLLLTVTPAILVLLGR